MAPYLLEHPNPHGDHFYRARKGSVLAIVVHITAGLEDLDGVNDQSAEKTAAYAASTDREVSWHSGSDADSALDLLPASYTAWHCQGYNSRTYGHEISKAMPDWRTAPALWVEQTLRSAARALAAKAKELGVPARHATKAELDAAIARNGPAVGFIGHAPLDPTRRRDPGIVGQVDTFPWARFLELVALYQQPTSVPPAPTVETSEESMDKTGFVEVPHRAFGLGRAEWDPGLGRDPIIKGAVVQGPDPDAGDDWWENTRGVTVRAQARAGKVVLTTDGAKNNASVFVFVTVA